jgi:(p)ppGpp synthase/HD superfamily hydrolase
VGLQDRPGALAAVTAVLAAMKTDVRDAQVRTFDDKTASIELTVRINDLKHLDRVLKSVRGVSGVIEVARQAVPR